MAQPVKHNASSAVGTIGVEAGKGGVGGSLLGMLTGGLGGAIVAGAIAFAAGGFLGGAAGLINPDLFAKGTEQLSRGLASGIGGLTVGGYTAAVGAAIGGIGGALGGAGAGGLIGMFSGGMRGADKVSEQDRAFNNIKRNVSQNAVAQVREEAADKYTQVGYKQGFEDGQVFVVNKIAEMQNAMMAEAANAQAAPTPAAPEAPKQHAPQTVLVNAPAATEVKFTNKVEKAPKITDKPCCKSHTEAAVVSKAAANAAQMTV